MGKSTFLYRFIDLIEREGFDEVSVFVNDWVAKGGTFRTLHQWILLKGIDVTYYNVWLNLRKYLTVSFDYDASFKYKWDSIAQTKGYNSLEEMMADFETKYTTAEMAQELGITRRGVNYILARMENKDRSFDDRYKGRRKIGAKRVDKDGFTMTDTKEQWDKLLKNAGFESLTEAVTTMNEQGMNLTQMADKLGVTPKALKWRIQKAGIDLTKSPKLLKRKVAGLLD